MATKYLALLTNVGAAKLANATALGSRIEITQIAVGDGNGILPTPNPTQTALVNERRRAPINSLSIDKNNASQIIAEQVIPEEVGGWWIREIGLFDKDGDMIAIANCAETYKPQLQEGSGRVQVVRVILIVSSTDAVTLRIDPAVVLATRQYVDNQIIQVKFYADQQLEAHISASNPHSQYLLEADIDKYIPVGFPLPWPQANPPVGWIKCNGAIFDKAKYPKLAKAYPSGTLPDLRGEFLRAWDDGRGLDSGRELLSSQNATTICMGDSTKTSPAVVTFINNTDDRGSTMRSMLNGDQPGALTGLAYTVVNGNLTTGSIEQFAMAARPYNVAMNMIVRAA